MPLHLEPVDVMDDVGDARSVLIVACPVCPPVSLAMQTDTAWLDIFRHGVRTEAFDQLIDEVRASFHDRGIRTGATTLYAPSPMMCIWTRGQQRRMRRRARGYDAVVVLGCASAAVSVERALAGTGCRVVLAMRLTGLTNALARFERPSRVLLAEKAIIADANTDTDIDADTDSDTAAIADADSTVAASGPADDRSSEVVTT